MEFPSGSNSQSNAIPLSLILLLFFFFQAIPPSTAGSTNNGSSNEAYVSSLDPSMGIVVIVLVCAFFTTGCIAIYIRGCVDSAAIAAASAPSHGRYLLPVLSNASQGHLRTSAGLDRSAIESFPTFVYSNVKELKLGKGTLECAVCLSEFDDDDTLRLLPKCEHAFHCQCIDAWLAVRSTCPVCRSDLVLIAAEIAAVRSELVPTTGRSNGERDGSASSDDEEIRQCECGECCRREILPGGEDRKVDAVAETTPKPNPAPKVLRSNSTGHSVIIAGDENADRFRLRLPEEVRRQILVEAKMRRAKSYGALPRAPSSRKGYRSGEEGSNSRSGRLLRWTGLVKSRGGETPEATSSDAILVAMVVNS